MSADVDVFRTMPTLRTLRDLVGLCTAGTRDDLYVRWSRGPAVDLIDGAGVRTSRDALTGVPLPGLSANALRIEEWWADRPVQLWLARKLYDYQHLERLRGPGIRPWVLHGVEVARGPDNEPLVDCCRPVAWVGRAVLAEARALIDDQGSREWGPMDRRGSPDA